MYKKLYLTIRFLVIFVVWTVFWCALTQQLVLRVWNFNFLSKKQWQYVDSFWDKNGVIQGGSDYMLFLALLLIVFFWIRWGLKLSKVQYFKLLLKPFEAFSKHQINSYANEGKNIVVKNLEVGKKITLDDLINDKIKDEDARQSSTKESVDLRTAVVKKISESKKS